MVKKVKPKKAIRRTGPVSTAFGSEGDKVPAVREAVTEPEVSGRKYALIIAVEEYQDREISNVQFAEADALGFRNALLDLGFNGDDITLIVNERATKASTEFLIRSLLRKGQANDECLIYYAGHGFAYTGHNYVTAWDTQRGDFVGTSIRLDYLMEHIRDSACTRITLFLDSCFSGLPIDDSMRDIISYLSEEELNLFFREAQYRIAFASCRGDEKSYHHESLGHGVWTHHLLKAIIGEETRIIERGRYITARGLQDYLNTSVPLTLREIFADLKTQTPCMYGNQTREFVVADLAPVLERRRRETEESQPGIKRMYLKGINEAGRVRLLSGFKKGVHHEPDDFSEYAAAFITRISEGEINEIRESLFQRIRHHFGYGLEDIEVYNDEGGFTFICKDFELQGEVFQSSSDPAEYKIRIEARNIGGFEVLRSEAFNNVFESEFDTIRFEVEGVLDIDSMIGMIEQRNDPDITVDYGSGRSSCKIILGGFDGYVIIYPNAIVYKNRSVRRPIELYDGFGDRYRALSSRNLIALPGSTG